MKPFKILMYASAMTGVSHLVYTFYNIITNGYIHIVENNPYVLWVEFFLMIVLLINIIVQGLKEAHTPDNG